MTGVTVMGRGAIGGLVAAGLARGDVPGCSLVTALNSRSERTQVLAAIRAGDVVVEATTVESAQSIIGLTVAMGRDIVVCSAGALAEPNFLPQLSGPGRIILPAGAIGGFDLLAAAARADRGEARAQHITVKRAAALGADPALAEPVEVFRGSARDAALRYPRTSNSSVALALATVGLDRLEVIVMADPAADCTHHTVRWSSAVGRYEFRFHNTVDPASGGRTSAITAWSVLETLSGLHRGVGPGVVVQPGGDGS
ncbi:aspartate dehydrogenase domain-containing protein [Mycolicibacterium wolinskyi]|uniref:aspartate dehydrogenase domain-containing protein n=1 Tax=Mycolicibacterium wolinskyi TaxID=59750 RepID=UPI0039178FBF